MKIQKAKVIFGAVIAVLAIIFLLRGSDKVATVAIGNTKIQVEIADDLSEQIQGLSGRDLLCGNCGMLFVYKKPELRIFWMKDMSFPLDIIFIRDEKVTEIFESVPFPQSGQEIPVVASTEAADAVLEVNAGFVRKHGIDTADSALLDRD